MSTYIIAAIIFIAAAAVVFFSVRRKKGVSKCSGCSCGCDVKKNN